MKRHCPVCPNPSLSHPYFILSLSLSFIFLSHYTREGMIEPREGMIEARSWKRSRTKIELNSRPFTLTGKESTRSQPAHSIPVGKK